MHVENRSGNLLTTIILLIVGMFIGISVFKSISEKNQENTSREFGDELSFSDNPDNEDLIESMERDRYEASKRHNDTLGTISILENDIKRDKKNKIILQQKVKELSEKAKNNLNNKDILVQLGETDENLEMLNRKIGKAEANLNKLKAFEKEINFLLRKYDSLINSARENGYVINSTGDVKKVKDNYKKVMSSYSISGVLLEDANKLGNGYYAEELEREQELMSRAKKRLNE